MTDIIAECGLQNINIQEEVEDTNKQIKGYQNGLRKESLLLMQVIEKTTNTKYERFIIDFLPGLDGKGKTRMMEDLKKIDDRFKLINSAKKWE